MEEHPVRGVGLHPGGGFQVIKKRLSYREKELLGRPITKADGRNVTETARRCCWQVRRWMRTTSR